MDTSRLYPGSLDAAVIARRVEAKRLTEHIGQPVPGDVDRDGDVDSLDVSLITGAIQQRASAGANDRRDVNRDGRIDALDTRVLATMCTRPRCATQ